MTTIRVVPEREALRDTECIEYPAPPPQGCDRTADSNRPENSEGGGVGSGLARGQG